MNNCSAKVLLLSLCVALAGAEETAPEETAPDEPSKAEILSHFDPKKAEAMGMLAKLAYCGSSQLKDAAVEGCQACKDAGLEITKGSVKMVDIGFTDPETNQTTPDANFIILARWQATEGNEKGCVVATRGSFNDANWVSNAMNDLVNAELEGCADCKCHEGYLGIWKAAKANVTEYFKANGCGPGEDPVYVTGHSLGGSVSTVAVAHLTDMGYNVKTSYIIEPKRVGDPAFAEWYAKAVSKNHPPVPSWRITHGWDVVPRSPSKDMGYRPIPYEIWYPLGSQKPTDYQLCVVTDNKCVDSAEKDQWWAKESLMLDHLFLPFTPDMMEIAIPPDCSGEDQVGAAVAHFFLGPLAHAVLSGPTWFVIYMTLFCLCCCCGLASCIRFCCCQSTKVGDSKYDPLNQQA